MSQLNNWFFNLRWNKINHCVSDNDVFTYEDGECDGSGLGDDWDTINNIPPQHFGDGGKGYSNGSGDGKGSDESISDEVFDEDPLW